MAITLTETAAREIKDIIKQQNLPGEATRLRVGVKGGGCSGFSYLLDLTEEPKAESDEEIESHGVKILCDMKSYLYLNGVEIDFKAPLRWVSREEYAVSFDSLSADDRWSNPQYSNHEMIWHWEERR